MKVKTIQNSIDNSATLYIYGGIAEKIDGDYIAGQIVELDKQGLSNINLRINSAGGSIIEGLSIVSAILNSTTPIHGYNDGICASMAGIVLMSCNKIYMADYAQLMIHNPSLGNESIESTTDEKTKNLLMGFRTTLAQLINKRTRMPMDEIYNIMSNETWYTAKQAKKNNLIDEIITYKKSPKITNNMNTNEILENVNNFADLTNEEEKIEEIKVEEVKVEEVKIEETKVEEVLTETKVEETRVKNSEIEDVENKAEVCEEDDEDEDKTDEEIEKEAEAKKVKAQKARAKKAKMALEKEKSDVVTNMAVEIDTLKAELDNYKNMYNASNKLLAEMVVNEAISSGKLSSKNKEELISKALKNVVEFKSILTEVVVKAPSISNIINQSQKLEQTGLNAQWTLLDYMKKDPKTLENILTTNPEEYSRLYEAQYGVKPSTDLQ